MITMLHVDGRRPRRAAPVRRPRGLQEDSGIPVPPLPGAHLRGDVDIHASASLGLNFRPNLWCQENTRDGCSARS